MTLDEYAAWAAGVGATPSPRAAGRALLEDGLGLAGEVGEVAGVLAKWLRDAAPRPDRLADELGDVAYHWARLAVRTGLMPSTLLAQSRAHVDWRRAGRPPGGPATPAAAMTLADYTAWATSDGAGGRATRADDQALLETALALVGDTGEVVECVRRLARGGDGEHARLAGELGDVWLYWTRLCVAGERAPAAVLAQSRAKIEDRLRAIP